MGLFNTVNFSCKCPFCGKDVTGFQTKEGDCVLVEVEPTSVPNFYSKCSCGAWIEFTAAPVKYHKFCMEASTDDGVICEMVSI